MYSADPPVKSAKRIWNKANAERRLELLKKSGCKKLSQAYLDFDSLPLTIKLDLNHFVNASTGGQQA